MRKVNKRSSKAVIKKVPQSIADFLKACKVDTLKKSLIKKKKKKKLWREFSSVVFSMVPKGYSLA